MQYTRYFPRYAHAAAAEASSEDHEVISADRPRMPKSENDRSGVASVGVRRFVLRPYEPALEILVIPSKPCFKVKS